MADKDPDLSLVALFKNHAVLNEAKTASEGRPIYDDVEIVEIRAPGSRNMTSQPATAISHWAVDPFTGAQRQVTYAERFSRQYQQFKARAAQTKSGTPLDHAPFLTEGRRAELRAQNVYTVEQLALIDGQELKNLGPYGRDLKNKAQEYMSDAKRQAPNAQLMTELEALRARNQTLEEDAERTKRLVESLDAEFDGMTDEQLRGLIKAGTGHAPQGNVNRKTLVRMAVEAKASAKAA